MAIKKRNKLFYNCIWTLILAVLLALPTLGVMELSTLALEQETRCGQQEHNHTQECYFRDMLICEQKAHNHSENCYLVLLADNDINWLLSTIEDTEEKSLEDVIDSAMVQALNLNPNLNSGNSQQIQLAADNVRQLNDVIAEHHIEPAVVLNENIRDNYLAYVPPQPEPEEEEEEADEEFLESPTFPAGPAVTDPTTIPQETTEETEAPETTVETEPTETTVTTEPPETTEETEPPTTTEGTDPPETTEETEPPATTEGTEPPVTTEETEPPETTEETEPPETTEETEPPVTTEETEPPETTEETEPPATTEETEPPATTEETEPPATTEETEPPATTEETEPPATTEETEPPETTEETEPPATTEETEPPETTVETEPSETGFLWETGNEIPVLSGEPAGTGEAALYLYHGDYWVCIDVLSMDQETLEEKMHYSISPEAVCEAFAEKIHLAEDRDPEELLYYAPQSPAEGIEGIAKVGEERLKAEETPGHFYLVDLRAEDEDLLLYEPVPFHRVVLESSTDKTEYYVQSGCSLSVICDQAERWQNEAGEPITGSELVTEDLTLYARPMPDDLPEEPETTGEVQETEPVTTEETEPVSTEETQPLFTDMLMKIPAEGSNLMLAAPPAGNEGIAVTAFEGEASDDTRAINFYLQLDGEVTFVDSGTLTNNNSWQQSGREYCSKTTAVNAYTSVSEIVTGLTTNKLGNDYSFRHGTKINNMNTNASYSGNNVYFANTSSAQHAVLSVKSGNSYTPAKFYTVKLDLSAVNGTDQVRYVESGLDSGLTLSDEYLWYSDEAGTEPATAEQLKGINSTTTLYAKPKNKTVTFETNGGTKLEPKTVPYGTALPQFENPTNGDLYLEGWYSDAGLNNRFDLSTPITEHMTLYAKWVETCVVSFEDAEGNAILEPVILGAGMELTLPEHYDWLSADHEPYVGGQTVTITESTKFIGAIHTYTLNFHSNGTVYETMENIPYGSLIMLPKDPEIQGYRFLGWYMDEAYTQPFSREDPIVSDMDLYARWGFDVTLHYLDLKGEVKKQDILPQISGDVITLPEHYTWTDPGADLENPEDDTIYQGGETVTVLRSMTLIGQPDAYTIRYVDQNGNDVTEAETLEFGSSFFFPQPPEGCVWEGSDGSHYVAGDYYDQIASDLTFTAVETSLTISYNVSFPQDAVNSVDAVPTLYGTTSATAKDTIRGGQTATMRSLTSNTARKEVRSDTKESQTYYFSGWKVNNTDVVIPADAVLSWTQLAQYADARGNVNLTGVWVGGTPKTSVSFYIRLDSRAVDTDGNIGNQDTSQYTNEIFNTYLGGLKDESQASSFNIADTTEDNSYGADQAIRALYGERAEGIWMYEFPQDEDVFAFLREYQEEHSSNRLTVGGEVVNPDELDSKHYAIRWYVFKTQGNAWHVDGKLVRREGLLNIYKDFEGEGAAIDQAEDGFYIVAENGTKNAAGEFVPYPSNNSNRKQYTLTLADAKESDASAHTYYWEIKGVLLGEYWRVTEYPVTNISGYSYYAEYSVYDSDGELTAIAEHGTQASVVGKTFALDEDPDQGMTVEFTNYYYDSNSILLKKEDAATGLGISGAGFRIIQKDKPLFFERGTDGSYSQNPDADNQDIITGDNGYVTIDGFSYQYGAEGGDGVRGTILIQESIVPEGYGWAATIDLELDKESNNVYIANMTTFDGQDIPQNQWSKYAELPRNDVLIVKNHVTELISVTANKVWRTNVPADSVEVVLQANGQNAANIFPGLKNAQVKLSAANNWTYTWENLPRYASGQTVQWGIKEVVVGNAPTLADGVTFANWIPSYSLGSGTDTDRDGDIDNWSYTVTNSSKSPKLILSKVGVADEGLPGAVFTLEQVELKQNGWQRVSGTSPISQTTDDSGMLTFENLVGTYTYRLTEVKAPAQHIILIDPLVFTVDGDGRIQKLDDTGQPVPITGEFLKHPSAYNLVIKNLITVEMPETGGSGTPVYWLCGMALMLTALLLYKLPIRKEELNSS